MRVLRVFAEELLPMQLVQPLGVETQRVQLFELVVLARGGAGAKVEAMNNMGHVHPVVTQTKSQNQTRLMYQESFFC